MTGPLESYGKWVEEYTRQLLEPYVSQLEKAPSKSCSSKTKEVNDPIWQTIALQPFEVIVLDSPLLQRLRQLRQLGVVHWVYPGAEHTRLEHSIGVVHQVQQLVESISRTAPQGALPLEYARLLRLAGLCHDVGHGLMSHVSENALATSQPVLKLRDAFLEKFYLEKVSLSEMAAYFMLGSPAFKWLVDVAEKLTGHTLPADACTLLQTSIIGLPILDRIPLLQEIITGPFDADKLDYMSRDARLAGVPVVTDIPRLVQKVRLVEVREENLPREIAKKVTGGHASYFLQTIALSGARTLDELMIGRTLLFDKVYRHQKVRAAEAMVAILVAALEPLLGDRAPMLPLLLNDYQVLDLTKDRLMAQFGLGAIDATTWDSLEPVRRLAQRLLNRRLFVRAYAFASTFPHDSFRNDSAQRLAFEALMREASEPEPRAGIIAELVQVVARIGGLCPGLKEIASEPGVKFLIALDPPNSKTKTGEMARAYLVTSAGKIVKFREDSAESPGWSNAYLMTRDLGYVFASEELAPAVFLAAEVLFRTRYGLRTPPTSMDYAKIDVAQVEGLRRELTDKGFYDGAPNDLRAEPKRLAMADVANQVSKVVERLSLFEGAGQGQDSARPIRIDGDRVRTWLRQFRTDDDVECALQMLQELRLLGRGEIVAALKAFLDKHREFHGAFLCPFGSPKDSSAIVTYYGEDIAAAYGLRPATLADALQEPGRPIIFLDDFIGSGRQSRDILLNWLGQADKAQLHEDHGAPLHDHLQKSLLDRDVSFVFSAGETKGLELLLEEAKRLNLRAFGHVETPSEALPKAFEGGAVKYTSEAKKDSFRERCREIGKQLLMSADKKHTEEWIAERALGYGNNGYLVCSPYNVPTQSLSLLWSSGKVDGWEWLPLLPRRAKR